MSAAAGPPPTKPLKVLMCHGFTQSGPLFHAKTRALEKSLKKAFPAGISLVYPTGPVRVTPADIPNFSSLTGDDSGSKQRAASATDDAADSGVYGWWVRRGTAEPMEYDGIERGIGAVADVLRAEGPFDGVIGFSQGGALAGMLASLLEPGRRQAFNELHKSGGLPWPDALSGEEPSNGCCHPPLRFAVSYSGYGASPNVLYRGFSQPKIRTPVLSFLGQLDTVVEEHVSLRLVEQCEGGADGKGGMEGKRVIRHPGGHFLPASQKEYVNALIAFIKEVMSEDGGVEKEKAEEERVEDMDMPF